MFQRLLTGPRTATLVVLTLVPVACDSPASPGPALPPTVETTTDVGPIPLTGQVSLTPYRTARDWGYAVDLDGDGVKDVSGVLRERIELPYRFETHGIHSIRVVFDLPSGRRVEVIERILAFDPDRVPGLRILARRLIPAGDDPFFEGIASGPAGRDIYVGAYRGGFIQRLDAESLMPGDSVHVGYGAEGLAVHPDGGTLLAVHKSSGLSVVNLPTMSRTATHNTVSGFYVAFADADLVLAGGNANLYRFDLSTGHAVEGSLSAAHFDLSPDGRRVALTWDGEVHVADSRSLRVERTLAPNGPAIRALAFHPDGDRLYLLEDDLGSSEPRRLLVVDPISGDVLSSETLPADTCSFFCVANPVATSREGTWIVFAEEGQAFVVDARTDRVALHIDEPLGSGVAASAVDDDVFYFVDGGGVVTKVRLRL